MTMNRQDYRAVADVLASMERPFNREPYMDVRRFYYLTVSRLCLMLGELNANFDEEKFREACSWRK
jgi:hypothetical protein